MSGSGHLLLKRGRSGRVLDSFWKSPGGDNWSDYHTDQLILTKEEVTPYFQAIVDAGIFVDDQPRRPVPLPEPPFLVIVARINGREIKKITRESGYVDIYRSLLRRVVTGVSR
jgi:hypothetical protein